MRIVVDAMGSDNHPSADVAGAVDAARAFGDEICLVGDEAVIRDTLRAHDTTGLALDIVHAAESVTMTDRPSDVTRGKPNSSMHVGLKLVKDGAADAFVSAGNTGAILSIAMLASLGRIRGVKRPALGTFFPTPNRALLIDIGANADVRPEFLLQFAVMGSAYVQHMRRVPQPTVGLISNGEEEGKGTALLRETAPLLAGADINYVGSIEPKDFFKGAVDVAVTDGFTGNIMLKTAEATAATMLGRIRDAIMASTRTKIGGWLARPAFDRVRQEMSPDEIGGSPLLGLNGVVVIGHGRSNAYAIRQAILQARRAVTGDVVPAIAAGINQLKLSASDSRA